MNIFELFGTIGLKGMDGVNKQLDGLQGKLGSVGDGMKNVGTKMTKAGGVMVGAVGAIAIPSLKMAADFDTAMRSVNTMLLLNEDEFKKLSDDTREMARSMGVDVTESAAALYQAISAGVPKENVVDFLTIASKAAIGGMTDTKTAVSGFATVLNAFKLPMSDTQKVADLMFTTVAGGVTTFEELSASLFQVAPIAAASGVGFDEVSAALATLTKQGVPTSVATTQLRQAMVSLQKPTKEMGEVIEDLGYESGQSMLAELGFAKTINTLRDATGGSNELLMKMFGSVEAGSAILGLTGENAEMFAEDLEAMANSAGAADAATAQMEESTSRQMAHLMADLKDVAMTIGEALMPVLQEIVETVVPIVQKVGEWVKENPKLVKTILVAVGAIGGLLVTLGPILMVLGSLLTMLPVLGGAFAVLLGPVGLVIAAIAAVIAIGVLLYKNWDTIKEKATSIWDGIANFFKNIWDKLTGIFKDNWEKILLILFPAVGLPVLIAKNWGAIVEVVKGLWDKIKNVFSGIWDTAKEWGLNLVKGLWEGIKSMGSWIWDKVKGFAEGIFDKIKEGFGKLWPGSPSEAGIDIGESLATGIQAGIEGALGNVRAAMGDIATTMTVNPGTTAPVGATITNTFNIAELVVRSDEDVKRIAREMLRMQQLRANYG